MIIDQPPAKRPQPGPPLPAEPHESSPPARRDCRWTQTPCDCRGFCHRAAADHPIEAAR